MNDANVCPNCGHELNQADLDRGSLDPELYDSARKSVLDSGVVATSRLQKEFDIGYGKARKIIDKLEDDGVIGQVAGTNRFEILLK